MSEVANVSENQQNTVPMEQTTVVEASVAEASSTPTPTEAEADAETPTATSEKQVVNNSIENEAAAAGDAGTSAAEAAKSAESSPKVESKKTPVKRTPSKRMSFIERAQKESEELVKNMGGSLELEGGRRTRSSARSTPTRASAVSTPPPAKKARTSPANASNTPNRGRGRGRKIDISEESEEAKEVAESTSAKTPGKANTDDKKQATPDKPANIQKEVSEHIDESSAEANVAEKPTEKNEEKTEKSISNIEQSEDKTDANAETEVITEEKQGDDKDAISKETQEKIPAAKQDTETPMETDESVPVEEAVTATAAEKSNAAEESTKVDSAPAAITEEKPTASTTEQTTNVAEPQELTPEPMDVDSNSKSSDVELIESASEVPAETKALISAPAAVESTAPLAEAQTNQKVDVADCNAIDAASAVKSNNIDNTAANTLEITPKAPAACEVGIAEPPTNALHTTNAVDANAKTEAAIEVSADVVHTNAENEVNANNDESVKPDNDLCVPKVVSPSINNANTDGTVTTIL